MAYKLNKGPKKIFKTNYRETRKKSYLVALNG